MSTMQHTPQLAIRHRIWLVAAALGAAAVLTLVLISVNGGSSAPTGKASSAPSHASRASVQKPQAEPEALVDARFRHPAAAGQR
jgi:hypothetical protein